MRISAGGKEILHPAPWSQEIARTPSEDEVRNPDERSAPAQRLESDLSTLRAATVLMHCLCSTVTCNTACLVSVQRTQHARLTWQLLNRYVFYVHASPVAVPRGLVPRAVEPLGLAVHGELVSA